MSSAVLGSASPLSRPAVVIVADDLTGACDAALPFVAAGRTAAVGLDRLPGWPSDVIAVSTETRDKNPADVACPVAAVIRSLADVPVRRLLKKIDSRLRGPVGAEILAALRASGAPFAVLAPGLPRLGRFVENGILYTPDEDPIRIGDRLAETAPLTAVSVPAGVDPRAVAGAIRRAAALSADVVVCGSATEDHLRAVASAIDLIDPAPLLVGASGVAAGLAGAELGSSTPRTLDRPIRGARVLFVLGSLEPVLGRQAERLVRERPVARVRLEQYAAGAPLPAGSVMLESIRGSEQSGDGGAPAARLGEAAAASLTAARFDVVACSGGAVAASVCRAVGVDSLELVGELTPGFALARVRLDGEPSLFALRSGGFGADDDLVQAYDRLVGPLA